MNNLKVFLLSSLMVLSFGVAALAQESAPAEQAALEAINLDENIQPEDLGVGEPTILPDSPFYFLKNWGRNIQSFFTPDPSRKAALRLRFANEKIIELKKLTEKTDNPAKIKKGIENYQKGIEKLEKESIKAGKEEPVMIEPETSQFLDKFIQRQILHQKLLQKLETQVPAEVSDKIKEARERHLEKFGEVITKLEDKDKIPERLGRAMEEVKGSQFKNFKNLEVLKNLEEKVPEQAKEAIQRAQENTLKRLAEDVGKMSSAKQEEFKGYIEKISGEKEKHLEIMESVKAGIKAMPQQTPAIIELKEKLMETTAEILETMGKKMEITTDCPAWEAPGPAFCAEGRVIVEKNKQGCYLIPRCVIPEELIKIKPIPQPQQPPIGPQPIGPITVPGGGGTLACIEIWAPVCGKNGKTYSNECFAKMAGAEIAYKGECKGVSPCPKIYCTFDPCPGKHGPDSSGCTNCATPCQGTVVPAIRPEEPDQSKVCIQVMTPAISPDGGCKVFPNPCEVPKGWKKVADCPTVIPPTPPEISVTTVIVDYVIDGDTVELRNKERVRLIGINTPEMGQPYSSEAKNKLKELIEGKEVKIEKDITDRDQYGRLLRYIWLGDTLINLKMVSLGYANSYTYPPDVKYQDQIVAAEREAREKKIGLWAPAEAGECIIVSYMHADAAGNDNYNLNDEYVIFKNICSQSINMANWTVKDEATHIFTFSGFYLSPQSTVTLYSGSGTNTTDKLYWNRANERYAIWNNDGDTVYLRDTQGNLALEYSY